MFEFVSQKIFVKPRLLAPSVACVGLPGQSGRRDLEPRKNHNPPMFVPSRPRLFRLLSLVKMFGNVSLHCLGFVTPRGS